MNVLVIGANGQIGKQVVKILLENNYQATAMVRDPDQQLQFEKLGAKTVVADLNKDFSHAYYSIDAVVFTAGSGGHTGADKTILIDQEGAIQSIEEAKRFGVKRYIMVSAMGTDNPREIESPIKHYLFAKMRADEHLKATNLNYTIVRPGGLTNEPGNGKVKAERKIQELGNRTIPREDVAKVIVESLEQPATYRKVFELLSGDTPITDALKNQ